MGIVPGWRNRDDLGVSVWLSPVEGGRLGGGTRVDVRVHPPLVQAVEYELSAEWRDDLMTCGPVVLVSEQLADEIDGGRFSGFDLVPATIISRPPEDPFYGEQLPADAPTEYRWVRPKDAEASDLRVHQFGLEVSDGLMDVVRRFNLENADVFEDVESDEPDQVDGVLVSRAIVHGPGDDGSRVPTVEGSLDGTGLTKSFASISSALDWARPRARTVLVHLGSGTYSAGDAPHGGFDPLTVQMLADADREAHEVREAAFANSLVWSDDKTWMLTIKRPRVSGPLEAAESIVRAVPGVDILNRQVASDGSPLWLVLTKARSRDAVDRLARAIADALRPEPFELPPDGSTVGISMNPGVWHRIDLDENFDVAHVIGS